MKGGCLRFLQRVGVGAGMSLACLLILMKGEVHAVLELTSSLSVQESYNDNLFFTELDTKEDIATYITPIFRLSYRS